MSSTRGGKPLSPNASWRSRENDARIRGAIGEARIALGDSLAGVGISADAYYQLSNRIAVVWWLGRSGVPVILMYLGFLNDDRVGTGVVDDDEWRRHFSAHCERVLPLIAIGSMATAGESRFRLVVHSRSVPMSM
jgi:hypothetical protein